MIRTSPPDVHTGRNEFQDARRRAAERMTIIDEIVPQIIDRPDAMTIATGIVEAIAIRRREVTP